MQTVELQSRPLAVLTFAPSSIAPRPVNPRPRNEPPAPAPPSPSVAPGLNSLQEHFVFFLYFKDPRFQIPGSQFPEFPFQDYGRVSEVPPEAGLFF